MKTALPGRKLVVGTLVSCSRWLAAGVSAAALLIPGHGVAQPLAGTSLFQSSEVVTFSILIGIISAAMLSAIWLIRQRGNVEQENRDLRAALADSNHRISRFEALVADKNHKIVVWDSAGERPVFLGQLPTDAGGPEDRDFLAFGRWLTPTSAQALDRAIDQLRSAAESFDIIAETQRGEVIEAQGRVSGGRAFVRFVALSNLRQEMAELSIERDRLHASISTFQALFDAIDMPVWQRTPDGRLVWVNAAYCHSVDAGSVTAAVRDGQELLSSAAREKIQSLVTPERPYHDRVSTVVRGNRTFFDVVQVRSPAGSAGLALDVSSSEAVREELNSTLKSHAETLDHLATPVAIFDGQQHLQFFNQAFQTLWQMDSSFLERKPGNGELLDRLRADGRLPEQLNWKQWKDNALSVYRAFETWSDLWYLPNGQTLRVFATARPQGGATWVFENLTEKVDLETRYNTLVQVQGETIDHLSEGVAVFGADGRMKLSNPAFRALWGIDDEATRPGTHIKSIELSCAASYDQPDGWKHFSHVITSFDDERPSSQGVLELRTGLILDYAIIPLPNAQTMLTFVNVTDSVRVERALTEKNEALRLADSLKNDFVQHVSYELRSPLTNIIGFADLLKTPAFGTLSERQAEYVDHISTSSALLLTIVNDILDLATVDAGIIELDYSEIELTDLLDEVSVQMASRLQESGITLRIQTPSALGSVVADHQRLKQIMIKLLMNAANFAPDGSIVSLDCKRDGSDFVFAVRDNGPGIPQDVLDTVFKRFESHGKAGGAGLGLSIVESFVSLHHGTVAIRSREGEGTEVVCRIPSAEGRLYAAAE